MSLRGFHLFFIGMVTVLSFAIAAILFGRGFDPHFGMATAGFGVVMALYGVWFYYKSRKLIL